MGLTGVRKNAKSLPQALKRGHIFNGLSGPTEVGPFPKPALIPV